MTISFNSVTLKNTQTEPQKYFFFNKTNNIKSWRIKYKNTFRIKFYFYSTLQKITVGGFVNQLIKNSGLRYSDILSNFLQHMLFVFVGLGIVLFVVPSFFIIQKL